ncbi:MAG: type 2 isopentenyl-diphosphate Delta-isomerase [Euryarchaeota archaeon]|nr:type 2 isopentenyl-diphosphate Delta-isomerase [Euryarchaeota archaeon]
MKNVKKTKKRKNEHINYSLNKNVQSFKTAGFEDVEFIHNAVPEVNFNEINTEIDIFGRKLNCPLVISAITGGTERAKKINKNIARVCNKFNIGMGVGSQRAMIEDPSLSDTYGVREEAKDILLIGNLGLPQFIQNYTEKEAKKAVESIGADLLAVHLNPLQEIVQPEGDTAFKGGLQSLRNLKNSVDFPLIAKETGAGISKEVAEKLRFMDGIDVGGLGGTSFSAVEYYRVKNSEKEIAELFWDWGIPTVQSIVETRPYTNLLIATGGIRTGIEMAKSIALGADCCGMAHPILKTAESYSKLDKTVKNILLEFKKTMFLVGSDNIKELKESKLMIRGKMRDSLKIRGYAEKLNKFLTR